MTTNTLSGYAHARTPKLGEHTNNKGQVTLFVIMALVIIGGIILYFVFTSDLPRVKRSYASEENPLHFIAGCVEEAAQQGITTMMEQGGYIDPTLYANMGATKVGYLCYTAEYNKKCVNQEPLYTRHLEQELKTYLEPEIERCFTELENDMKARNIATDLGTTTNTDINITLQTIKITITKDFSFNDRGTSNTYNTFPIYFESNLHELSFTLGKIVSHETQFCDFDYTSYMTFNPEFTISQTISGDGTKFYTVIDTLTSEKANIAIRGCVLSL